MIPFRLHQIRYLQHVRDDAYSVALSYALSHMKPLLQEPQQQQESQPQPPSPKSLFEDCLLLLAYCPPFVSQIESMMSEAVAFVTDAIDEAILSHFQMTRDSHLVYMLKNLEYSQTALSTTTSPATNAPVKLSDYMTIQYDDQIISHEQQEQQPQQQQGPQSSQHDPPPSRGSGTRNSYYRYYYQRQRYHHRQQQGRFQYPPSHRQQHESSPTASSSSGASPRGNWTRTRRTGQPWQQQHSSSRGGGYTPYWRRRH